VIHVDSIGLYMMWWSCNRQSKLEMRRKSKWRLNGRDKRWVCQQKYNYKHLAVFSNVQSYTWIFWFVLWYRPTYSHFKLSFLVLCLFLYLRSFYVCLSLAGARTTKKLTKFLRLKLFSKYNLGQNFVPRNILGLK